MVAKRIQGNYDCLEEAMRVFMRHADMTVALTFQVEGLVDQLQGGAWRGVGAEAFYAEMREVVFPAMRKLEDALQFAGEGTGKIHHILREAEEEAARLFRGVGESPETGSRPQQQPFSCQEGEMSIHVGSTPANCVGIPGFPDVMSKNGWSKEDLIDIAKLAGIDPLVLAMVLQREWSTTSSASWSDFLWRLEWSRFGNEVSAGIGNIKASTALPYLEAHRDRFAAWLPYVTNEDGTFNTEKVIWRLFSDSSFNILVAATILGDDQARIKAGLKDWGVTLTQHELDDFTMAAYNGTLDNWMIRLNDRSARGELSEDIYKAIINTINVNREYVYGARVGVDQAMFR